MQSELPFDLDSQGGRANESGHKLEKQVPDDLRRHNLREGILFREYKGIDANAVYDELRNETPTEVTILAQVSTGDINFLGKVTRADLVVILPNGKRHVVEMHRQATEGSADYKVLAKIFNLLKIQASDKILIVDGANARSLQYDLKNNVLRSIGEMLSSAALESFRNTVHVMTPQQYVAWYAEATYPY